MSETTARRQPLRQGLQRPPGRGPVRGRTATGAQGLRREERLPRGTRVRGRGRERARRRQTPVPQDDRRGQQDQRPLPGDIHPTDTIATENSGTRGRSVWVHSSSVGLLDNSLPHRVGPLKTSVALDRVSTPKPTRPSRPGEPGMERGVHLVLRQNYLQEHRASRW